MSNALAIASVTAILRDALNDGLINRNIDSLFDFQVTAQPPDRIATAGPFNRLNLFLYRVTPNPGWTNTRLPARSSSGERVDNPFLALDLHYLLSSMSSDDLNAEILLGYGMQVLHETPVLGRDTIRAALAPGGSLSGGILPTAFQQLSPADLADQFEQIKISPYNTDLDEVTKIWTAMNTPMRMSALYQVTTVLIESRASRRSALPVTSRAVFVRPMQGPSITRILSRPPGAINFEALRPIIHGDTLRLEGSGLRGAVTVVGLGDLEVTPSEVTADSIIVDLPATLHPGVNGVVVRHRISKLTPSAELMPGETSNVMAFVLRPRIAAVGIVAALQPEAAPNPGGLLRGMLQVALAHDAGGRQRAEILLNELNAPANRNARAYTFPSVPSAGGAPPVEVDTLEFEIRNVAPGDYLVRVRIDGADSVLEMTAGGFSGPQVTIA